MNATGNALFGMPWVKQIVQLFSNFGWALYIVGIVVALFDFAIESQNGRGDPKALALNIIKGVLNNNYDILSTRNIIVFVAYTIIILILSIIVFKRKMIGDNK